MPTPPGPSVQLFGLPDSRPTQAAQRFFRERRVAVTYVDLRRRPIAPGELRRFVERLGAAALLDTEARRYRDLGLGYMRLGDDEIVERLLRDNQLIRLPLVRFGNAFTAGPAEDTWRGWVAATAAGAGIAGPAGAGKAASPTQASGSPRGSGAARPDGRARASREHRGTS